MGPVTKAFLVANVGAVGTLIGGPIGGAVAAGVAKGFIHHLETPTPEAGSALPSTSTGEPLEHPDTFDHLFGGGL